MTNTFKILVYTHRR